MQEHERFGGQILNRVLLRAGKGGIRLARVAEDAIRQQAEVARRSQDARAPVSKAIPVPFKRHARRRHEIIGTLQIAKPRVADVQQRDQRRRLREAVSQTKPDADPHSGHTAASGHFMIILQGCAFRGIGPVPSCASTGKARDAITPTTMASLEINLASGCLIAACSLADQSPPVSALAPDSPSVSVPVSRRLRPDDGGKPLEFDFVGIPSFSATWIEKSCGTVG
jgi:hypothetical protein